MRKKVGISVAIILLLVIVGCAPVTDCAPKAAQTDAPYGDDFTRQWYVDLMSRFGQADILESVEEAGAAAEYRVIVNYALLGYNYYALQVYEDGTGRFAFIVYHGEDLREQMVNESIKMGEDDVSTLKKAICRNRFWEIPTVHPDEELGCDGWAVFVEGCEAGSVHFINMWSPKKRYGIYKIFKAFEEYGASVAENPLAEYQNEYE